MAEEHYCYEAERLVLQSFDPLIREPPGKWPHRHDALLEAALLHVRVLDAFFHDGRPDNPTADDSVVAGHYLDANPSGFLTKTERRNLNAQLAHLAARRVGQHPWRPWELALKWANRHNRFRSQLARVHPERVEWFARASTFAAQAIDGGTKRTG
jgi:hypothetical protein